MIQRQTVPAQSARRAAARGGALATALLAAAVWLVAPALARDDVDLRSDVRLIGRAVLGPQGVELSWSAGGVELELQGGRLEALIEETGQTRLDVTVDGETRAVPLAPGTAIYDLVDAAPGRHRVAVSRRTEPGSGRTTIRELHADGAVTPTPAPARRLLFIGDSITAGYGADGADQWCSFSYDTENVGLSWAAVAAREVSADFQVVAVSGRGLVRNDRDKPEPTMLDLYRLAAPGGPAWSPASFRPDAVAIHLGTNDFDHADPGEKFVQGYLRLLDEIERDYPDARIYAAIGPLLQPGDRPRAEAAIRSALARHAAAGGRETPLLSFGFAGSGRVYGCDWHPGRDTQAAMGRRLADQLERDLGWSRAAPAP